MPTSTTGFKYILTSIDLLTRWVIMTPLKNVEAQTVINALINNTFKPFRQARRVITDNGTHFIGVFDETCRELQIQHTFISAYRPNVNGICERAQGTIKTRLWFLSRSKPAEWSKFLTDAVASYNHSIHKTTGFSPYYLLCGGTSASQLDSIVEQPRSEEPIDASTRLNLLADNREIARQSIIKSMQRAADKANNRSRFKKISPGDYVMILKKTRQSGKWRTIPFSGPYRVVSEHKSNTYFITCDSWSEPDEILVHADRLKQTRTKLSTLNNTLDASKLRKLCDFLKSSIKNKNTVF